MESVDSATSRLFSDSDRARIGARTDRDRPVPRHRKDMALNLAKNIAKEALARSVALGSEGDCTAIDNPTCNRR